MPASQPAPRRARAPQTGDRAATLAHLERRLLEERRRAVRELGRHAETFGASMADADGDLSSFSLHMADHGTDAMEREKAFLLAGQEGRFLWHVDEALRRLYRSPDTFGRCHGCERDIAFERLDAVPHARYCIDCKQREESGRAAGPPAG
jgi:RNA polymerase-binding transcription factor DksA